MALARLSLSIGQGAKLPAEPRLRSREMFKIRLTFAFAATVAAALTTFVTVAPQPASAGTVACAERVDLPVLA